MHNPTVEMTEYGGFVSYGVKPISTNKPGINNYYVKDAYKEISDYHKRKIDYFDDKIRWNSVYEKDMLQTINKSNYHETNKNVFRKELDQYEYTHEPTVIHPERKDEESTRNRFEETKLSDSRRRMFSNWDTTYRAENKKVEEEKTKAAYPKAQIDEQYKSHYHNYHHGRYKTEHTTNYGVHGDQPVEKFFNRTQGKLYSDNWDIAKGTTKQTNIIPGYSGFIPTDKNMLRDTVVNDPYFYNNKTNHVINYNTRLTGYGGYIPLNAKNIKGNVRPYCLSTEGETFN